MHPSSGLPDGGGHTDPSLTLQARIGARALQSYLDSRKSERSNPGSGVAPRDSKREVLVFTRILVPLDGSRFSELAVPVAQGLASRVGASLHLVTVAAAAELGAPSPDPARTVADDDAEAAAREEERYLEAAVARMGGGHTDPPVSQRLLVHGPVVDALRLETEPISESARAPRRIPGCGKGAEGS